MKILCVFGQHNYGDPTRGEGYEYTNFIPALHRLGHDVQFLESWNRTCYRNFRELNEALLHIVDESRPDVLLSVMFTYEIWTETWEILRDAGISATINWTTDDSWKYAQFSRFLAPSFHAFTTTYPSAYVRYHQDSIPHVLLIVVEWGTNIGVSARIFHEINIRYKIGAEIHSVELPNSVSHAEYPQNRRGILVRGLPVYLHQGDGPVVAASLLREKSCPDPLVFIDGDHARESVLRDAKIILEAASRAALLFHDTFYQPGSTYNHGPYEAVKEILEEAKGLYQVVDTGLGCPGMILLVPSILQESGR
jgi:hypothetical protein